MSFLQSLGRWGLVGEHPPKRAALLESDPAGCCPRWPFHGLPCGGRGAKEIALVFDLRVLGYRLGSLEEFGEVGWAKE